MPSSRGNSPTAIAWRPTTEVLAKTFFEEIARELVAYAKLTTTRYKLRPDVRLVKVRVWETSSSWAEYEA